ncbi:hypothetical protein ABW21_db0203404 [Orbilia brochopaga]|nr:hypothetical protein ABW21_db0203404 [Drechslerella brochopaga]
MIPRILRCCYSVCTPSSPTDSPKHRSRCTDPISYLLLLAVDERDETLVLCMVSTGSRLITRMKSVGFDGVLRPRYEILHRRIHRLFMVASPAKLPYSSELETSAAYQLSFELARKGNPELVCGGELHTPFYLLPCSYISHISSIYVHMGHVIVVFHAQRALRTAFTDR